MISIRTKMVRRYVAEYKNDGGTRVGYFSSKVKAVRWLAWRIYFDRFPIDDEDEVQVLPFKKMPQREQDKIIAIHNSIQAEIRSGKHNLLEGKL